MAQTDPSSWDFSKLDSILEKIISTPKHEVLVGWPAEKNGMKEHEPNPRRPSKSKRHRINLATLAAIHDLGLGYNPERPFVRQAIENRRKEFSQLLNAQLKLAYSTPRGGVGPVLKAYGRLGAAAAASIAVEVANPDPPFQENTDETIERKGSDQPLVDTGQLKNTAQWVIRKPGETRK